MMKRYVAVLIASVAFLAANHATTLRAQSPQLAGTYLSLLSQGFEVKSIILISDDAYTRADRSVQEAIQDGRIVVVTLQQGAVTAQCWIAWSTYATGNPRDRQGQLLPMNCYY